MFIFSFTSLISASEQAEKMAEEKYKNIEEHSDQQMEHLFEKNQSNDYDNNSEGQKGDDVNIKIWRYFYKIQLIVKSYLIVFIGVSFITGALLYVVFIERSVAKKALGIFLMVIFPVIFLAIAYYEVIVAWTGLN